MNKSIIKHELRSLKWIFALGLLVNIIILAGFNQSIDITYTNIFVNGLPMNQSIFNLDFYRMSASIVIGFMLVSVLQVYIQFQSEKKQEVSRFIKSLPIKDENLSITKILLGILNITILFVILYIGLLVIKHNNMFWVEDIYNTSNVRDSIMALDQLIYPLFLIYLATVCFYTFLVMVQYMVSNNLASIVIGILVWFAPMFIVLTTKLVVGYYNMSLGINWVSTFWLNPSFYIVDLEYLILGGTSGAIVRKLNIHYLISLVLIIVNIIFAIRISMKNLIEDENKFIPLKSVRFIFILGVTICSSLLVSYIYLGLLDRSYYAVRPTIALIAGGLLGFVVSRRIARIN